MKEIFCVWFFTTLLMVIFAVGFSAGNNFAKRKPPMACQGGDGGDTVVVNPKGEVLMWIKGEPGGPDGRGGKAGVFRLKRDDEPKVTLGPDHGEIKGTFRPSHSEFYK